MTAVRLRFILLMIPAILALAGCAKKNSASGDADSTSAAGAKGSMESDAENVGQSAAQKPAKKKKKRERTTSVSVSTVFRGSLVLPVSTEGTIRARHETELRAEIAGTVVGVYASEGQRLRRGQLIARLDNREYEAALEEARARYLQALSVLSVEDGDIDIADLAREVRDEFASLEKLERQGKLTRAERVAREVEADLKAIKSGSFRFEVAAARSGVSEARASLARARVNLERTEIRAPFSGVLTGFTMARGERVTVNETLGTLVDNLNLEAEVGVLEADLAYVEEGKPALVEVPALSRTIPVTVDVVSPSFDSSTRTCRVLLRLKNEDGKLRPGMFVRAEIAGRTFENRLLVPREAILTRDGRPLLFKASNKRASWLYVKLGEGNEHLVEVVRVLQGGSLEPGDEVIVPNHLTLAHEAKIRVKKHVPLADPWVSKDGGAEMAGSRTP